MGKQIEPYEVLTIRTGYTDRKIAKYVAKGWEVVAQRGGVLGTAGSCTLRRPNPKLQSA